MNKVSINEGEKLAFLNGLKQFLEDKGKILVRYPRLAGKIVDLHDLYYKVTSLGGYQKVTDKDLWDGFLKDYNFQVGSATLSYGLKVIYQRFLEEYERVHYFGDDEGSKKPRFDVSIRMTKRPLSLTEYDRKMHGLSATRFAESRFKNNVSDYEKLTFSLISCLPNEVDFAINACTLLSGESRHVLRISRCPQVLEALLLHAGIVSDEHSSFAGIAANWVAKTGHDLARFWKDTVIDEEVLHQMLLVSCELTCKCDKLNTQHDDENQKNDVDLTVEDVNNLCGSKEPSNFLKEISKEVSGKQPSQRWSFLFQSKRASGVQDYEGQRVLQIALVLLNLSFEDFNVSLLAYSKPLLRFIFLCIHSSYSALRQTGLDILGNISAQMDLLCLGMDILHCTHKTVQQCIMSNDKFDQIRGFEILGNLCRCTSNKDCLILSMSEQMYSVALHLLTLGDIELLLAALEALYGMTKLGEETCTQLVLIPGSIGVLISLITINIRAFGAEQLSRIRIARRILPGTAPSSTGHANSVPQHNYHPAPTSSMPPQQFSSPHNVAYQQSLPTPPHLLPQPHVQPPRSFPQQQHLITSHQPPQLRFQQQNQHTFPKTPTLPSKPSETRHQKPTPPTVHPQPSSSSQKTSCPAGVVPMYTHAESQSVPPVFHYIPAPPPDIVLDKSPESFAQLWVWATYESCSNDDGSTPRVEVFAEYAAAASRYGMCGTKQVLPAAEFGRCLQRVFPHTASRLFKDDNTQPMYHITGIRKRPTPLPVPGHHPQSSTAQAQSSAKNQATPSTSNIHNINSSKTVSVSSSSSTVAVSLPAPHTPQHIIIPHCASTATSSHSSVTSAAVVSSASSETDKSSLVSSSVECSGTSSVTSAIPETKLADDVDAVVVKETVLDDKANGEKHSSHLKNNKLLSSEQKIVDNLHLNNFEKSNHVNHDVTINNHNSSSELKQSDNPSLTSDASKTTCSETATDSKCVDSESEPTNHCGVSSTIEVNSKRTTTHDSLEKEVKTNSKSDNSRIHSNSDVENNISKTANSTTDAVICNGELPSTNKLHCQMPSKIDDLKKKVLSNDLSSGSAKPADPPLVNGDCHSYILLPQLRVSTAFSSTGCKNNINQASVKPPQISPISPERLHQQYNSQKQLNNTNSTSVQSTVVTSPTITTSCTITMSAKLAQGSVSSKTDVSQSGLKRPLPDACSAPAAKIMRSSVSLHDPTTYSSALTITSSTQPISIPPPLHQIPHSYNPPVLHSSALPHSYVPPHTSHPLPSQTPPSTQRKPPVIDLMAPNAALMVLYRNSGKMSFEDILDEKEDPISKSVRLTSSLILKNIALYSDEGRSLLQRHEAWLSYLSMSGMDCSPVLAKLLSEMDR